jgi:hypothetical protein
MHLLIYIFIFLQCGSKPNNYIAPQAFVGFQKNSIKIDKSNHADLKKILLFFEEHKEGTIEIAGYRDSTEKENISLERAITVKKYLIKNGVDKSKIDTVEGGSKKSNLFIEIQLENETSKKRKSAITRGRVVTFMIISL